ncbi:MAG TPA: type VI secretion system tube protein Hcp [Gaiellaceae bacterium]|jgi:type VI secretion system secreted protein Hcp
MRKKMIWAAAALVLIAAPAAIGLIALGGDDASSDARRAGALLDPKSADSAEASLALDGLTIPGPAQAIDVESYSFGVANTGSAATAGGAGAGKANFTELTFTKTVDVSSPVLMKACATGQHMKTVTLSLRKAGGTGVKQPYMTIKMSDAIISSYQVSGSKGSGVPAESVAINFAKIEYSYSDGGAGSPSSQMVYDLKLAKAS